MNLHTNLPFDHRPARGACRREQCRGGGAGEEAEPSGTSRADSTSRQAPATSRPAAGHPNPPPRRRPGARKPRKSELRPEALGSSHPGGSLQPGAHGQFPPWLACSSQSSRIPGKIPLRQESAGPALVPRRQAGACTRGRKPRQTRGCTQGAHAGPPAPVAPLQAVSLPGAAAVRFAEKAASCDPRVSQVCGRLCGLHWPPHPQ